VLLYNASLVLRVPSLSFQGDEKQQSYIGEYLQIWSAVHCNDSMFNGIYQVAPTTHERVTIVLSASHPIISLSYYASKQTDKWESNHLSHQVVE